jgi:transcriptional regulator with XRE-family HTH domain
MRKIIELRKERLTQRQIAKEVGVSLATVNRKLKEETDTREG